MREREIRDRWNDKRSETERRWRVSRKEKGVAHGLKGRAHTEFQACARYLLGISSRHISVVTHRILAHPRTTSPFPPSPVQHTTPVKRNRLTRSDILFAKSPDCKLPLLLILCAQEFLSSVWHVAARRLDFIVLIIFPLPPSHSFSLSLYLLPWISTFPSITF